VKYALIRRNRRVWPIRVQCRMLGVSVAGYHEHLVRRLQIARRRHLSTEALLVHIRAVYAANRGAYGWPRIWRELHAQDIRVGKLSGAVGTHATVDNAAPATKIKRGRCASRFIDRSRIKR